MSDPEEMTLIAFPRIVGIVAEACYNDPEARHLADKEGLVDYDDADASTKQFWRHIAATSMDAAGHAELVEALQQFVNGVETRMIDSPADETLANITSRAKAALAKARGDA